MRRLLRRAIGPIAAVAAAVAAFVLGGALPRGSDEPAREDLLAEGVIEFETMLQAPDGDATAEVTGVLTGIGRVVQLRTDDLAILPKGEFYEVCFVGPGDTPRSPNRISAGRFHPDEQGYSRVDLTAAVDPEPYPELSVIADHQEDVVVFVTFGAEEDRCVPAVALEENPLGVGVAMASDNAAVLLPDWEA